MNIPTKQLWFQIVAIVAMGAALAACGGAATPSPTAPANVEPTAEPSPTEEVVDFGSEQMAQDQSACAPLATELPKLDVEFSRDESERYFDGQLVLSGNPEAIDAVLNDVSFDATLIDQADFSFANDLFLELAATSRPTGPVVQLVQFEGPEDDPVTVLEAVEEITALAHPSENSDEWLGVFADPNYVLANRTHGIAGSPYQLEPSSSGSSMDATWAWNASQGINLAGTTNLAMGAGVSIVVFDTSAFGIAGSWEISRPEWTSPLTLCVSLPESAYINSKLAGIDVGVGGLYESNAAAGIEHGLFVAGLAKKTAPDSSVHLIRVMDDTANGDMFTLIKAMGAYLEHAKQPSVFNLSLGFHVTRADLTSDLLDYSELLPVIQELIGKFLPTYPAVSGDDPAIASLSIPFTIAEAQGYISVAAAGNGRTLGTQAELNNFPARFPSVMSIGASTMSRNPACFTDPYEVLAPGGDAVTDDEGEDCVAPAEQLTGLVTALRAQSLGSAGGYGNWTGTSFAAPQVSGLGARILSITGWNVEAKPVEVVRCLIVNGARATNGVINIPNTVDGDFNARLQTCIAASG